MTKDQEILRQAAAWVRGMADAAHHVLTHAPEQAKPIPIPDDPDVFLAGRPGQCGPNQRILNCIPWPGARPKDTVTIQDVGDALARIEAAADLICRGLGDEGVTPVASEIRRIVEPPER